MTDLTGVSLFAGVGGIDLGLEAAGIRVTAAVEIDKQARGVLADRLPHTTLYTDVTKVTADELRATGFVPERGVLTAGFPCQDLSVAGRRRGMGEGTRSGLWWHVVRLLGDLRPAWFVGENVPGLLSAVCPCPGDGRCADTGRHADDCGEWRVVKGTREFHPRALHNVKGGACPGDGCIALHGGAMGAVLGSLADLGYGYAYRVLDAQFFGVPQRRRRVAIVGRLADARGPVQVLLEPASSGGDPPAGDSSWTEPAVDLGYGVAGAGRPGGVANPVLARDSKSPLPDQSIGTVVLGVPEVAATLQGGGKRGQPVDAEGAAGGHLVTFRKSKRAQTTTDDETWVEADAANTLNQFDVGDVRATELIVEPPVAFHQRQDPISGAISPALGATSTVRRLTPVECERLQGFPDDWTATSNGKPQADSHRYRQMGNAVAVPVFVWISRRIVAVDGR